MYSTCPPRICQYLNVVKVTRYVISIKLSKIRKKSSNFSKIAERQEVPFLEQERANWPGCPRELDYVLVQFSHSVVSNSATPWTAARHASLSITNSGACSNSCPSTQWCHPTTLSSVFPFSSCFKSFPASGSFPMSQFFTSGGQSIGVSASASVL